MYIAEIIGTSGINGVLQCLPEKKKHYGADLVLANANSAAYGFGLSPNQAFLLRQKGVDFIFANEQVFFKKAMASQIDKLPFVLKPYNFLSKLPGNRFYLTKHAPRPIVVVNLLGQTSYSYYLNNPLLSFEYLYKKFEAQNPLFIVNFHSQNPSEKLLMADHFSQQISLLIGSHQKLATADERIIHEHLGYISDAGLTGSTLSVGGFTYESQLLYYKNGIPVPSVVCNQNLAVQGVIAEINETTGQCSTIERFQWDYLDQQKLDKVSSAS